MACSGVGSDDGSYDTNSRHQHHGAIFDSQEVLSYVRGRNGQNNSSA